MRKESSLLKWSVLSGLGIFLAAVLLWQPSTEVAAQTSTKQPSKKVAAKKVAKRAVPAKRAAPVKPKDTAKVPAASAKPAARPAAKPAVKRASTSVGRIIGPMAVLTIPSLEKSIQRALKGVDSLATRFLKRVSQEFIREFGRRFLPQVKQIKPHRALQLVPPMLNTLGFDLNKPMGVFAVGYQPNANVPMKIGRRGPNFKVVPVVMVTVKPKRLLGNLGLLGLTPRVQTFGKAKLLTLGGKTGSAIGLMMGDRLYLTLRNAVPRFGLRTEAELRNVFGLLHKAGDVFARSFQYAKASKVWSKLQKQQMDIYFLVPDSSVFNAVPRASLVTGFLKSVGLGFSLQRGYSNHFFLQAAQRLAPIFNVLGPTSKPLALESHIPASLGWMGQAYLNVNALNKTMKGLMSSGILPPMIGMMVMGQYMRFKKRAQAQGLDIDKLAGMVTGQFRSGMLWGPSMQGRLQQMVMGQGFRGHMRGAFVTVVFKKKEDGPVLLRLIESKYKELTQKRPRMAKRTELKVVKYKGFDALRMVVRGIRPYYLVIHGRLLVFVGDQWTFDQFAAVWKGKAPSLAQQSKKDTLLAKVFAPGKGNFAAIHPRVMLDAMSIKLPRPIPPMVRETVMRFLLRVQYIRGETSFANARIESNTSISVLPKPIHTPSAQYTGRLPSMPALGTTSPLNKGAKPVSSLPAALGISFAAAYFGGFQTIVGIGAAVAIPAFLRFTKRSKSSEAPLNLKALGDGAISWFDAEHSDTNGNPLAKHFPHTKSPAQAPRGISKAVAPKQRPCANGKARYPKNTKLWDKEPWKSLKFGINKPHYYQYVYITSGTGKNAKFTLRAHADLDCDGKLSTYEVRGSVSAFTGEVERSNLIVTNALE